MIYNITYSKTSNEYYYIHCISFYLGNNRLKNIQHCINNLNKIKYSKNLESNNKILFIINCIYDNLSSYDKEIFEKYKLQKTNILDIEILYRWNSGGTIRSMEESLKYILKNNIKSKYIGIFEDDSFFNKDYIFDEVEHNLKLGYDIIGCHVYEKNRKDITHKNGYKILNENSKFTSCSSSKPIIPCLKLKHVYLDNYSDELLDKKYYKWIDGAVYLTTINKLIQIKNKLKKLTLAPYEKYKHIEQELIMEKLDFLPDCI